MSVEFLMKSVAIVRATRTVAEDDFWGNAVSTIELDSELPEDALSGIESFSHVEILFVFDRVTADKITVGARHPRNNPDWPKIGIFAQRGKNRPNRIGSTICRILKREGRVLTVAELDAIDGTPVLDIKPVMQEFLPRTAVVQADWSRQLMQDYWKVD